MMRIAIVGAGITGLSAALALEKARTQGAAVDYVLFESASRVGGSMFSERVDGCLVEGGPDSFLTEKPWAAMLCRELGIADRLIGSNDHLRKTYIVVHNRLIAMPDGLQFMVPTKIVPTALSPLFSWGTKLRMAGELLHPPRPMTTDETVAEMVERHFGAEVVDRLADPLLSGVYGGDAGSLSARAVLPRFVEMEEKYGSLSRAMLAARKRMKAAARQTPPPPLFTSLEDGMQQLVTAITERLTAANIRTSTPVRAINRREDHWELRSDRGSELFEGLIFATPAWAAGQLISAVDEGLGADLAAIPYSSSITVTMGYSQQQLRALPPGFGFLVPRSERRRMLACTFVHNKFPHRAPEGKGLLRCFLGGSTDEAALELSDGEVEKIVRQELKSILQLNTEPRFTRIYRWRRAMAQYSVGHLARVTRIEAAAQRLPGFAIAGNCFRGIGVPDCIRTGQAAAAFVAKLAPEPRLPVG
ncbi:MAG: protoporphyrinogen oxidase [Candidatus Korobacteraceae bacterium]